MLAALPEVIESEPIERRLQKAAKSGLLKAAEGSAAQLDEAVQNSVITLTERELMVRVRKAVFEIISTDDFDSSELEAKVAPVRKPAKVELRVVA